MTLEALAQAAVAGDANALASLCRDLQAPVFRLCLRMLGEVGAAEDAAQDVIVKVVTNLSRFEGRSALSTWVHQIAVRHVLSVKKSRAEEHDLTEDDFAALLEQGLHYGAHAPAPGPDERVLLTEVRLSCTQGMLLLLDRDDRLALVLVELLGFDGAEAASLMELGHDTFRQRLSRARNRLGTFLQAKCGVVNPSAACHCEKQLPAKCAMGLRPGRQRFQPLSHGDLPSQEDVSTATAELKAVRSIASAFHRDGLFAAPPTLTARLEALLPHVLGREIMSKKTIS